MKIKYLLILLIVFVASSALAFEGKTVGIGVIAGQPTGITGKYMINNISAIDVGAGWETSGDNEYLIYGDYLYHVYGLFGLYGLFNIQKENLPFYFGGGVRYERLEHEKDKFGIRIPVGFEYLFSSVPLGVFIEVVPVLDLRPDTEFDNLEGGIGIRFYF
jgi:hypothetical protein